MSKASRRVSRWFHRHPGARLGALVGLPATWLVLAYLGSLAALFLTAVYTTDPFTTDIVKTLSGENFSELATKSVYRAITLRTIGIAAAVTIIDVVLAVPMALYIGKVARPRARRLLIVAVLMPLWASYLVKGYSWRAILDPGSGVLAKTFGASPGFGVTATTIGLAYLWLPYMILPIQAGLERLPDSLLEASSDLGGRSSVTIRKVVLPILVPAIVAGTVFTFSLSLGDYITVQILGGKTQMIGNVVYANFGSNNIPFAAAFAVVPVAIMVGYLLAVRRTGAFENL